MAGKSRKNEVLNVALIGTQFMGRAHSNAWLNVTRFFNLKRPVSMHTACGLPVDKPEAFAAKWGWGQGVPNYKRDVVANPDIELVDIATPNHVHAEIAIAALEAGKHVSCEKPLAGTLADAKQMVEAAKKAKRRKQHTFVWFNYRRVPAIGLAHQLVTSGKLGRIYHVRAAYLQEWGGPDTPLVWRFDRKVAGSGAHGDLNAHIIDMARFITGDEVTEVVGSVEETFIKQRVIPEEYGAEIKGKAGRKGTKKRMGRSTVDDLVIFLARFKGGAVASFEASRLSTGNKNRNMIEINGEHGSIRFDFERMNELDYYDANAPAAVRGWTNIMCTDGTVHPYVANWWPDAHVIGYEHTFVNQASDIVNILASPSVKPVVPIADFADAYKTQCVLEAAIVSARERRPVKVREIT